jgi:phosphoribosylaminoimidazole-succinocarboxamide synthase
MEVRARELLREGTSKRLYATDDPDLLVQYFKDDVPTDRELDAGGAAGVGRGVVKNLVSSLIFTELERAGVRTHFVRRLSEREMLVRRTEVLPVAVVVRNHVAGSLAARFDLAPGERLQRPLLELFFRKDRGSILVNDGHCLVFGWLNRDELEDLRRITFRVNEVLVGFFRAHRVRLVDFRLELGRAGGRLIVADELTPDTCRLWDDSSGRPLSADIYGLAPGGAAAHELYWILDDPHGERS